MPQLPRTFFKVLFFPYFKSAAVNNPFCTQLLNCEILFDFSFKMTLCYESKLSLMYSNHQAWFKSIDISMFFSYHFKGLFSEGAFLSSSPPRKIGCKDIEKKTWFTVCTNNVYICLRSERWKELIFRSFSHFIGLKWDKISPTKHSPIFKKCMEYIKTMTEWPDLAEVKEY